MYPHQDCIIECDNDNGSTELIKYESIRVIFAPYADHVKEGWNHRHHSNGLFLFHEDLIKVLSEFVMLMTCDGLLFPNLFVRIQI